MKKSFYTIHLICMQEFILKTLMFFRRERVGSLEIVYIVSKFSYKFVSRILVVYPANAHFSFINDCVLSSCYRSFDAPESTCYFGGLCSHVCTCVV